MNYIHSEDQVQSVVNLKANLGPFIGTQLENRNTWLYLGIAAAVFLVIILAMLIVLWKRIVIAIALIEEGSKYVNFGQLIDK